MSTGTAPDHGPLTGDLDAMECGELQQMLRLIALVPDLRSLESAVRVELEWRQRVGAA